MLRVTLVVALSVLVVGAALAASSAPKAVALPEICGGNPFLARNIMPSDNVCDLLGTIPAPTASNMGMAFDGDGYLWVGENVSGLSPNLYKLDPATGNILFSCGAPTPGYMLGLTYDPGTGHLWLVDWLYYYVVEVDPATCAMVSQWYISGTPRGLAYDANDDALVVGDTGGGSNMGSCKWYNRNGTPTGRTCSTASVMQWHMGMEFGPSGNLWCNDDDVNSDINCLDVSGAVATEVVVCQHPGYYNIPEGLTIDADAQVRTTAFYGPSIWTIESGEFVGDTAYCKVTDVSVPEDFYLPGDVIELTVNWKFVFSGNGSPGWSSPEDFKVGGGLGKEPNGQPRFIQNTMLYDVEPGSYQQVFLFTVPMATPLGTGVGGGGHCWPTWSGPNQPEQSVYIEHNLCMIDVYTPPEFLIYDLDPTSMSEAPIGDALAAMGHTYEITSNLMAWNLPDHLGLFVLLGMYPNNSQIAAFSPEALAIEDYIYAGGKCYMEGGDSWYYDPQFMGAHDFGPAFGIMGLADGSSDLYQVDGVANSWLPGLDPLVSPYSGENSYVSWLAGTGGGEACFQNVAYAYYCGVANGSWGKTVGTSFEIGGVAFCGDFVGQFANW